MWTDDEQDRWGWPEWLILTAILAVPLLLLYGMR